LRQARFIGDLRKKLGEEGRFTRAVRSRRLVWGIVSLTACAVLLSIGTPGRALAGDTITIVAKDAETGATIDHFRWMVNLDNSHDQASLEPAASYSPVVATGDESNAAGISLPDAAKLDLNGDSEPDDPNARGYLVSILANDGVGTLNDPEYKIGGKHFTLPDDAGDVVVVLQPNPLPLATLRVRVFHDNLMLNSEDDIPLEHGLEGFHIAIDDRIGEVTTDWFGNPLCTEYEDTDGDGVFDEDDIDPDDGPTPIAGTGGICTTGADGYATVPNLGPDNYDVEAIPPNGQGWIQTTTIEGTKHIEGIIEEGHSGFSTEEGFTQAMVWFGFTRACSFGNTSDDCTSTQANTTGTGTINGTVRSISLDDESGIIRLGNPVVRPYVGLNNVGGDDEQVYTGRGNSNGTFTIPSVPAGLYQLVIWDQPMDYIMQFQTVRVGVGQDVNLDDIGVPPWFGKIRGYDYVDNGVAADGHVIPGGDENGVRDCYDDGDGIQYNDLNSCEKGISGQDNDTRFKDGTIQYGALADRNGYYEMPEVFELEHFAIAEVGYGRGKQTGATGYETDDFGNPLNYPDGFVNQDLGLASLLQSEITWGGTTNYIDWGKKAHDTSGCATSDPSDPCENGGIVGIAFYDLTRNELDARLEAPEDYEPGIPGTRFNLYAPVLCGTNPVAPCDPSGEVEVDPDTGEVVKDHLAAVYDADGFNDAYPADCIPRGSVGRTADQVEPNGDPAGEPSIFDDCVELPALLPQIRAGVFDGGYAFDLDCSQLDGSGQPTGNTDEANLRSYEDGDCDSTPVKSGEWVVEVAPLDGFQVVKEEDINVFSGDTFVPQVPPPPCVGPLHTVDVVDNPADADFDPADPSHTQGVYNPDFLATTGPQSPDGGSPFEGERMPLCNERLIMLQNGFNANSDFFMFSDVPQPGRIVGVLLDDLVLELDPASPMYAEKRGIPNAPVGIRDYNGELITTVYSDENGYWEVELPSTDTYNCALPAGPCPGVYQVIGNDPGSPQHPSAGWNPNYGSLKLSFAVWPGLTTYADVAILPITGFVQKPGPQFEPPVQCDIPGGSADLQEVSDVVVDPGDAITITGSALSGARLDGSSIPTSGGGNSLVATIPADTAPGPHQLLATGGGVSPVGITVHVLGAGYEFTDEQMRNVGEGQEYATIQAALDDANDGDLILVHPGVYFESVLVDERVKLQGYGPGATVIDGRFFNFGGISADDFAAKIAATDYDGPTTVGMGQVITVLAEDGEFTSGLGHAQIDGFAIRGGTRVRGSRVAASQGGGIYAHAYARHLEVSNNLIQSNAGNFGGAVILGQAYVNNPDAGNARDNENDDVRIHHNRLLNNGGVSLAGGVGIFNGAEGTEIDHNVVCGNYSAEYGGGISDFGQSSGSIHDNKILYNFAFDEGGGVMIAGEEPRNPIAQISAGTGDWNIQRNLIQGNTTNDDGGGIRLLTPVDGAVRMDNNMIVDNLATDTGGGISLDDALNVEIVNNTVAKNVSTATAEDADRSAKCFNLPGDPDRGPNGTCPHGAGLDSELNSAALISAKGLPNGSFSDPVLFNNIFWQNEAFYLQGTSDPTVDPLSSQVTSAGYMDFEVLDLDNNDTNRTFTSSNNLCTAFGPNCPDNGTDKAEDPLFVEPPVDLAFDVLAFGGDPSFVTVILKSKPGDPQGNYHAQAGSPAVDAGTTSVGSVAAPSDDFDGETRGCPDVGADEAGGAATCTPPPPPPATQWYLSFAQSGTAGGVAFRDEDILSFDGTSFAMVFDGSDVGLGPRNVDAFAKLDADSFLISLDAPLTIAGLGLVDDSDIVRFDASSLGSTTAGTWHRYFDGSDVGLTAGSEDIDAIERRGRYLWISTTGPVSVPGVTGVGHDILRFKPTAPAWLGASTSGRWKMKFDGSDVGLTTRGERIDAVALSGSSVYLSTTGNFSVPGRAGRNEDIVKCTPRSLGTTTACAWSATLALDGSVVGLGPYNVDAIVKG
jgi:hypothetical protein